MKRFLSWLRDFAVSKSLSDRDEIDRMIEATFSTAGGKKTLDYLIAEHYAFVTDPALLGQAAYNEGRRSVIQDILNSIDRVHTRTEPQEESNDMAGTITGYAGR